MEGANYSAIRRNSSGTPYVPFLRYPPQPLFYRLWAVLTFYPPPADLLQYVIVSIFYKILKVVCSYDVHILWQHKNWKSVYIWYLYVNTLFIWACTDIYTDIFIHTLTFIIILLKIMQNFWRWCIIFTQIAQESYSIHALRLDLLITFSDVRNMNHFERHRIRSYLRVKEGSRDVSCIGGVTSIFLSPFIMCICQWWYAHFDWLNFFFFSASRIGSYYHFIFDRKSLL